MNELLRKDFQSRIKEAGEDTIEFVASDETVDRQGDIIRAAGWVLDEYLKNPVVLLFHDYNSFPVGKAQEIGVRGKQLVAPVRFARQESPEAEIAYKLAKGGFLNSMSVGFEPIAKETDPKICPGFIYTKQVLFELSLVPVPANPNAVSRAIISEQEADIWNGHVKKAMGQDLKSLETRLVNMEKIINRLEEIFKALEPGLAGVKTLDPDRLAALFEGDQLGLLKDQPDPAISPQTLARLMNQFVTEKVETAIEKKIKYLLGKVD